MVVLVVEAEVLGAVQEECMGKAMGMATPPHSMTWEEYPHSLLDNKTLMATMKILSQLRDVSPVSSMGRVLHQAGGDAQSCQR